MRVSGLRILVGTLLIITALTVYKTDMLLGLATALAGVYLLIER
jgi:hypothetical protein